MSKYKLSETDVKVIERCLERGKDVIVKKAKDEIRIYEMNQRRMR